MTDLEFVTHDFMNANQVENDLKETGCGFLQTCFLHLPEQNEEYINNSQSRACGAVDFQTRRLTNPSIIVIQLHQPVCYRRPS